MAGADDQVPPPSSHSLEKQFESFRVQLEESAALREQIRAVVMEIESATRLIQASLLLVHQSRPIPGNDLLFLSGISALENFCLFWSHLSPDACSNCK